MKNLIFGAILICSLLLPAFGLQGSKESAHAPGILPPSFNGWQKSVTGAKTGSDASVANPADSDVLKEYGFSDVELATYTREDRKLQVKAARFNDASGAYGAFSYYMQPLLQAVDIPDKAVSNNSRILFYRGNILVDVTLDRVTAMSASDLRALSGMLPQVRGNVSALPALPGNLPQQSLLAHTRRYIMGPLAMDRLGIPIPSSLVDFNKGAEVEFAQYQSSRGEANLTLIGYPTPQIAGERLRAMQAASLAGGPFYFKRSGPLLAIVNGAVSASEAQSLLASVNYDAEVTWNQPTKLNPKDNIGNLIVNIFTLIGLILLVALIFGIALGGVRIMAKKFFPNRVFDRAEEVEIIQLNLK